jgi:hypothetical protein
VLPSLPTSLSSVLKICSSLSLMTPLYSYSILTFCCTLSFSWILRLL